MGDRLLLSGHSMGPFGAAFVLLAGEGGNVKKDATISRTSGWKTVTIKSEVLI